MCTCVTLLRMPQAQQNLEEARSSATASAGSEEALAQMQASLDEANVALAAAQGSSSEAQQALQDKTAALEALQAELSRLPLWQRALLFLLRCPASALTAGATRAHACTQWA